MTIVLIAYLAIVGVIGVSDGGAAFGAPNFPPLTGRVVDDAGLLSPEDRRALTEDLRALEGQTTDQLVIYSTKSLQGYSIEDFAYQLGRAWQIGQKGKDNGVILIVAPTERLVRIEVGYGLEPQLTDARCKLIIEYSILPAFRRGDFPAGIKAGVRDIRAVLVGFAETSEQRGPQTGKPGIPERYIPESGKYESLHVHPIVLILLALFIIGVVMLNFWSGIAGGFSSDGGRGGGGGFLGGGGGFGGGGASGRW